MSRKTCNEAQVHELLYQALETESGGIQIYETAITCAVNDDLRKEWSEYLEQTRGHHQTLLQVFEKLGLDAKAITPGRKVVAHIGKSLVQAMKLAKEGGDPQAAERTTGALAGALKQACEEIEDQEDHHLYHTKGWTRELWIHSLGFPAVLPPPEEVKKVETAIGAARAEQQRESMIGRRSS